MGSGASMEDKDPPPSGQPVVRRPVSRQDMEGNWRQALKTTALSHRNMRKMKAAVLGRKSACTVEIDKSGFSLQHIQICEGQTVCFMWNDQDGKGYNITQVVHDGETFKTVIGGFNSGETRTRGFFEQQFNLCGEYKFVSTTLRSTPLTIEVYPRRSVECELTDTGFNPSLIRMDEGTSVHWRWSGTSIPHTIAEVRYNHKTGRLVKKETDTRQMPSKASDCIKEFPKPGIYYYQTESMHPGEKHTCLVHVRERQREYKFEILDKEFQPSIHVIQEGDRVWWQWDKTLCEKSHRVYQVEPPALNHPPDASYKPLKGGFSWPSPSRSGLVSKEFFEAGVYHFSDHNRNEAAEYMGTVIVKPKQIEHYVEITKEGFTPDLVYANAGDRVWWTWLKDEVDELFNISEIEKCISPIGSRAAIENEERGEDTYVDEDLQYLRNTAGLDSVQVGSIGVYHYKVNEAHDDLSTCSVIVQAGSKNSTIHVTNTGFDPKVVTVNPGDRVWWVWQDGKKPHNIIQMSHQGKKIERGFCSGAPIDCPSAFEHQFFTPGVYYYVSDSLMKAFGAVVVASQPKVHEIQVSSHSIVPDPLPINVNDVVVWTFRGLRQNDLARIETVDQILDAQQNCMVVSPRRCLNQLFTERGVYHFVSKSFMTKSRREQSALEETRISSVLVDELSDSCVMRVDGSGFHPKEVTIRKDQSVLWSWKDCEQAHNIIHVNAPSSEAPLSVIQGGQSFNSGSPTPKNSFLYTFDEPGTYCVASQGAPGYCAIVHVLTDSKKVDLPTILTESNGGPVDKYHLVKLSVDMDRAKIYYTLDGYTPDLHKFGLRGEEEYKRLRMAIPQMYDPNKGIVLRDSGLCFVRAMAVSDGILNSDVYTSKRFWVLSDGQPPRPSSPEPVAEKPQGEDQQWKWWKCVPGIKAYFIQPGVMQVFWDLPHPDFRRLLKGYKLFLNDISYSPLFPPTYNSVTVAGMAGDTIYEVYLEAHPIDQMYLPHKSNKLMMKNSKTTSSCGPVISLEVTDKPDSIAIVWMSISTEQDQITGYKVYLNGRMCGSEVAPDVDSNRCKVVIEKCQLKEPNTIQVAAIPQDGSALKMSNELEVRLPLEVAPIQRPPPDARVDNEDLYREFLEVRPGEANIVVGPGSDGLPSIPEDPNEVQTLDFTNPEYEEYPYSEPPEILEPPYGASDELVYSDGVEGSDVVPFMYDDQEYVTEAEAQEAQARQEGAGSDQELDEQGPWKNKMKVVGDGMRATKRINLSREERLALERVQRVQEMMAPAGHYEVEVQDDLPSRRSSFGSAKGRKKPARIEMTEEVTLTMAPPEPGAPPAGLVPILGQTDRGDMPAPVITVQNLSPDSALVKWTFPRSAEPQYKLEMNAVNVMGCKFQQNVSSNISFECMMDSEGNAVPAVQHVWNITNSNQCEIRGLLPGTIYNIYVVSNYSTTSSNQQCEIQAKSEVMTYRTVGPPMAPVLKVISTDLGKVTFAWQESPSTEEVKVTGYKILVDGKQMGADLNVSTKQTTIDNLRPGQSISVAVVALTSHSVGESRQSNVIRISCPSRPRPPFISQQPSYKKGCVVVAWNGPDSMDRTAPGEEIGLYRVFLDGKFHGEVDSSAHGNKHGYQYSLADLSYGQSYDIQIRAYAGSKRVDPNSGHIHCISESDLSNTVPVMCPAPPNSPHLRLEGMHADGIDVTWEMPQQFGDAAVSGFQMMKDSKLYGSIIPADVHNLRIKGLTLGDTIELQILALTDHPVGRQDAKSAAESSANEGDSGFEASNSVFSEIYIGDRYSACKPGPKLRICYTGLVQPPSKVWCEQVSGHSAMIVWNKADKPQAHYVSADSYQVTWWPGDRPEQEINSQSTTEDHLLITGLRPRVNYNVVVEARKMQTYAAMQEYTSSSPEDGNNNTFILTAKSDHLTVTTARPPQPPGNLGVVATTCNSIQVSWDPPQERGTEIIGMRVDAQALKGRDPQSQRHSCTLVVPNSVTAVVDGLQEKTEYLVSVTAITEEYFEQLPDGHELKISRTLPTNRVPKDDPWLPSSSVVASTSGTTPPSDVKIVRTTPDSVTISWTSPVVFGSNRLQGTVVRWAEGKYRQSEEASMAHHKSVTADSNEVTIDSLFPGILYKIVVEAVVSVKTTLEPGNKDPQLEKQNRRTTHVMSQPVFFRTKAPCEPPEPIVVGYTLNTIQLYWEKPSMLTMVGRDDDDNPRHLKLSLEGYRLEINGKPHMRLVPSAQSCTLVKCKPGKAYSIVLVALTCTEDVKKDRKRKGRSGTTDMTMNTTLNGTMTLSGSLNASMLTTNKEWQATADDYENDESSSHPLEITLPRQTEGLLAELSASYMLPAGADEASAAESTDLGDIQVDWAMQGDTTKISQFTTVWTCLSDHSVNKKVLDAHARNATIPVQEKKCLYEVAVQPHFSKDVSSGEAPKVLVPIPGPPDPPVIFLRSVTTNEFVIEWAEPKLHWIKVDGYQVYMNGKKVGNVLSKHHRKAVMACKPNKQYNVQLVALTKERLFGDSAMSNMLVINTSPDGTRPLVNDFTDGYPEEDDDMMVRIVKVTDTSVQLEWTRYEEPEGMAYYKVVWSSTAQPTEKEVKLPSGEKSCVIHKCYAGTNHFIRIFAMGYDDKLLDKSRQISVQTSAAPDTPMVSLRACNFRYIAIQWEKPSTYGHTPVCGYKVFVNGVVEAQLGPDQYTYSLTNGKWCREYVFQVQAITGVDRLQSRPSDPLVVMWPGVQPPVLRRVPALSSNAVKVTWEPPTVTEGVKVKQYKVICLDELTERPVQVISPIHPETYEAEIHNLKQGTYLIYCEIHLHGTDDVVKSEVLRVQPVITPDPPQITVTVIGLEERRQIEKITCDLINKRDRLLNVLNQKDGRSSPRRDDDELDRAADDLSQVEGLLDDCLASLQHYTGHLLAHVSWTCRQSNPELKVTGYKVMVDGKQYGTTMGTSVKNIRIKLGLNQPSHRLSMVSVCDHPHTVSPESNVVELLTEPFQPFSFFNYLNQEPRRGGSAPNYSQCIPLERSRGPANQGLLKRQVAPPACTMMDLYAGEYNSLFPPSGPKQPTAIFFWADWCPMSKKMLGWFVRFARTFSTRYDFVSVACAKSSEVTAADKQRLVGTLTDNGWRDDNCIRHLAGYSLATTSTIVREPEHDCPFSKHQARDEVVIDNNDPEHLFIRLSGTEHNHGNAMTDVCELFGVKGIPYFVIVHPQDYVAWKGRYCPYDYNAFENFMVYILSQVMGNIPPSNDPWDVDIDTDALDGAKRKRLSESQTLMHRSSSSKHTHSMRTANGTSTTIHLNGSARPHSAKRFFVRTSKHRSPRQDKRLTVSLRPYSASSPYAERLTSTAPPRRARSSRRTKSLV